MLATVRINVMHVISFNNKGNLKNHKVIQSWEYLFSYDVCKRGLLIKCVSKFT
jgi:hypothetical protein